MPEDQQRRSVAIVGGGASGVLAARALSWHSPHLDLILIGPKPGRGIAYGGSQAIHVLNTRVAYMSVDQGDKDGFLRWLNAREADGRRWSVDDFAPRRIFGDYLQDTLDQLVQAGALRLAPQQAVGLARGGDGWRIALADGGEIAADAVLLATGNARPVPLDFEGRQTVSGLVVDNPWDETATAAIPDGGEVLVIGNGLTGVDVALTLLHRAQGPTVHMVSRRGAMPRVHDRPHDRLPAMSRPFPTTAATLYRRLRDLAEAVGGWDSYARHVIFIGLKPVVPEIWAGLPLAEKRRVARHLQTWWEVERHRVAPEIAELLEQGRASGRLDASAGRLVRAEPAGEGRALATVEARGVQRTLEVTRIINCTGPNWRVDLTENPLLLSVLGLGAAPDPMNLGLDVDEDGEVRTLRGDALQRVYALGPLTRGAFFEITAVPEIRAKADSLARRVAADLQAPTEGLERVAISAD